MTTHLRYLDGCHDAALHDRAPENAPSPPPFSKAENFQQPHLLGSGVYFVLEATVFTMPNLGLYHLPANAGDAGDAGSIPGSERSLGGRIGNPLQYSCLKNPMDRGVWHTTVHKVAKSWTRLRD